MAEMFVSVCQCTALIVANLALYHDNLEQLVLFCSGMFHKDICSGHLLN